jgi:hypothetical protein
MTPINRIPMEADSGTLNAIVRGELDNRDINSLTDMITEFNHHDQSENGLSCTLDWAMQIRQELGYSWSECIDAAMILYYG